MNLERAALRLTRFGPAAALLAITAIWGWTFLIVKDAVAHYPVPAFLAIRFVLALALLAPFAIRGFSWKALGIGVAIGIPLTCGYLFQTAGLTMTSAANAGLLTGLYVIFTPILDRIAYARPMAPVSIGAAVLGLAGTALLTLATGHGLNAGDLLEIFTALAFAVQIVWLGRYTSGRSSMQVAFGQLAAPAAGFTILMLATEGTAIRGPDPSVWVALIITSVLASALAFWVQTFVQQRIPPARAAVILLGEPAFAAAFAVWLGGERLSLIQWLGAALILLSLLSHEVWLATRVQQHAVLA